MASLGSNPDQTYFADKEAAPPILGCLLHPTKRAVKEFACGPKEDFAGARYGLCSRCTRRLRSFPIYQIAIDNEIEKRLNKLKEGKNV